MRERQAQLKRVEGQGKPGQARRRVLTREEYEIPAESDRWFNIGLTILGIAAGAGIAALTVDNPVTQAVLGTLAACFLVGGMGCLLADREINRGRRLKRSRVIEDIAEGPSEDG
jgi:hypothetical protein